MAGDPAVEWPSFIQMTALQMWDCIVRRQGAETENPVADDDFV
jgi:hypothetical protein